jgi:hypothetical protein
MNVPANGQIAPDLRRSDHAPFWDAGIKALMLTDGAEFRNTNYHTPGDSLGTLNIPFLVRNIQAVTAVAAHLAKPISADEEHKGAWQLLKDVPFSMEKIGRSFNVEFYPNPSNNNLYFKFNQSYTSMNLSINDLSGKILLNKAFNTITAGQVYEMPINTLKAGVYYVSGNSSNETFIKKLVVTDDHTD